jgi:hypothetical protein
MQIALAIGALLLICVMTTTRESRAEARERLRPYNRWLWGATVALWLLIGATYLLPAPSP